MEEYNHYINEFVNLNVEDKREEIVNKLKELIATLEVIAKKLNDSQPALLNREMIDLNQEDVSEEDYLEAVFAYLISLEDLIGRTLNQALN